MENYGRNRKWSTASGLAFWGSAIQTSFNLIGLTLVLYLAYNLVDIIMSGILPSVASMSLDYYEDRFAGFIGGAAICFAIAFLGYLFYMVGICLFTGAQRSENSKIKTRNIMLAELIGPALIILFYVGYYASPEILGLILEHYIDTLIAVCALSLAAVIIPMVEFKTLSKEKRLGPVRMVLTMHEGGAVSGTVTYLKYNVPMELTGSFTDSGDWRDLSLEERLEGKTTGNFIGRYDGKVFSGSWVSADGAKEMPFKVER